MASKKSRPAPIWTAADIDRARALMLTAWDTGAKTSDLLKVRQCDVSDDCTLTIGSAVYNLSAETVLAIRRLEGGAR